MLKKIKHTGHFEDFNRKQYTIEIFSPMSLFFHEDSKWLTLQYQEWHIWNLHEKLSSLS